MLAVIVLQCRLFYFNFTSHMKISSLENPKLYTYKKGKLWMAYLSELKEIDGGKFITITVTFSNSAIAHESLLSVISMLA